MKISIAERLKPFSHLPGTTLICPGSSCQLQIFPCLIRIYDVCHPKPHLLKELILGIKGPVKQFTICNDLEKGRISVWGETAEGWMRFHLTSGKQSGLRLFVELAPKCGIPFLDAGKEFVLQKGGFLDILPSSATFDPFLMPSCDRLSLGNHKKQDWDAVKRRLDLAEILPAWHRLGQSIPDFNIPLISGGIPALLEESLDAFSKEKPEHREDKWIRFFLTAFNGLLNPQFEDANFQGIIESPAVFNGLSPLILLSEGSRAIRHMFVKQKKNEISLLPDLLPCLSHGRITDLRLEKSLSLNMEWTKKTIRRLVLYSGEQQEIQLDFRPHVRSYRLRCHLKDKGEQKKSSSSLVLEKNCFYLFDNFK